MELSTGRVLDVYALRVSDVTPLVAVVARDITGHRRAEQEVERSRNELVDGVAERTADDLELVVALHPLLEEWSTQTRGTVELQETGLGAGSSVLVWVPVGDTEQGEPS